MTFISDCCHPNRKCPPAPSSKPWEPPWALTPWALILEWQPSLGPRKGSPNRVPGEKQLFRSQV